MAAPWSLQTHRGSTSDKAASREPAIAIKAPRSNQFQECSCCGHAANQSMRAGCVIEAFSFQQWKARCLAFATFRSGLLAASIDFVYRRPSMFGGRIFGDSFFLIALFNVLGLALLFVGVAGFVSAWYVILQKLRVNHSGGIPTSALPAFIAGATPG